ncbi:lysophospholipid acyltransferase family protein [Anaerotruncus rubiinfantis]|uniref:lysophospholipid acyltransferase family protein n=1 Tax=Anaerotruncus rubiinfantis TaxID=1720200 RepID=UPI0008346441|nr:lysophospholipid acyltransferase family protein [Anaerotruncus rubiinfantis]
MRTVIWFLYFWVTLVELVPAMLYAKRLNDAGKIIERDDFVGRKVYGWMSALLRLAGVTVEVTGKENIPDTPVLFVSNHQGNFDIPILLCNLDRPHGVVAKKELQKLPFVRVWMKYLCCVFIDRDNPRRSAMALQEAAQNLRDGHSMIIFPEGTRSRGDQVGDFKAGGFKIAQKTRVPIVPVCIEGSYRVMEANRMWIRPAVVRVRILPPVDTSALSKEDFRTLEDEVRGRIVKAKSA